MKDVIDSHDIDRMVAELKAAGWTMKRSTDYRSPEGALFRGPFVAWLRMKAAGRCEKIK